MQDLAPSTATARFSDVRTCKKLLVAFHNNISSLIGMCSNSVLALSLDISSRFIRLLHFKNSALDLTSFPLRTFELCVGALKAC